MVEAVFKHGGTLDKFIGDALMVTFGTPESRSDDIDRSLQAALDMLKALNSFNQELKANNQEPVQIGIGLHYGPAVVGNIGTKERLEYTVIGDTVNIASRLESACKDLNAVLVVSDELIRQSIKHDLQAAGSLQVKGRTES